MSVERRLFEARRWLALGLDPWGHSLARLLRDLPPEEYPDALPGLTPKEAYTEEAKKAVEVRLGQG